MSVPQWRDVIIRALHALGGSAPYSLLKPEIERRAERPTKGKWHQTVEGTVEQYSSDSTRGNKPKNFVGSNRDIFRKVGYGHWEIRDYSNPFVRAAIGSQTPSDSESAIFELSDEDLVFVREHWRRFPGFGEGNDIEAVKFELDKLIPESAWVSDTHLVVRFQNLFVAEFPLAWIHGLHSASVAQRRNVDVDGFHVEWVDLEKRLSTAELFLIASRSTRP